MVGGQSRGREDTCKCAGRHDLAGVDCDSDLAELGRMSQLRVTSCLPFDFPAVASQSSEQLGCGDPWLARAHQKACYWIATWIATGGYFRLLPERFTEPLFAN